MPVANQEEEDLGMALKQSMHQHESPEPKRSKPGENPEVTGETPLPEESPEAKNRRIQRELMAAAAEKRMTAAKIAAATAVRIVESGKDVEIGVVKSSAATKNMDIVKEVKIGGSECDRKGTGVNVKVEGRSGISETSLPPWEANKLFFMIFGSNVSKDILAQWSNQGIR
ncbi:hypothetical protein CDL12_30148 [Handroanthus impetiginosus]|uniref:Uncharacterized protein n=1 Tax=Handroanthus impetiginosus TaxID=429701 RepID=A0A2G9FWF9_9LAMI|nr:hypothetical protein CDL12_30148 [Handroanthus impetiginosus]